MQADIDIEAIREDFAAFPAAAQVLDRLAVFPAHAVSIVCSLSEGDYPYFEAVSGDKLTRNCRMVWCAEHGFYHLYGYSRWYSWLEQKRDGLKETTQWLELPLEDEQAWLLALIEDMASQVVLRERIREIPFRLWEYRQEHTGTPDQMPFGMDAREYRDLTRPKLSLPASLIPTGLLKEFYQCYRKTKFPTEHAAQLFLHERLAMGYRNMSKQQAYECNHCDQYHVGHRPTSDTVSAWRYRSENAEVIWNTYRYLSNRYVKEHGLLDEGKTR